MIEKRLQQAANALPEPNCDYLSIEEAYKQRKMRSTSRYRRRRMIAIICLALLLVGCVAGPTIPEYHLYNGSLSLLFPGIGFDALCEELGWDPDLNSAKKTAQELGWTIPDTLCGSPRYSAGIYNLTTEESHWFLAMLCHHYTYYDIDYGFEMETDITREDGTPTTAHWTDADINMYFGSTENPVWRRQFHFNEDDVFVAPEGSVDVHTQEYNGFTLYISTYPLKNDFYGLLSKYLQRVYWVDHELGTVFALTGHDDTPEFIIQCAQELIDQIH